MATLHTPKNKAAAKQAQDPAEGESATLERFEQSFNKQLKTWNDKIDKTVSETITKALNTGLTAQFENINSSLSDIQTSIKKLTTDNTQINNCLSEVKTRLDDVEKSADFCNDWQKEINERMKSTDDYIKENKILSERVLKLENQISSINQQSRQCNIEISNVPEKRGENLLDIVNKLSKVINLSIPASDVVNIHRVPHAAAADQKNPRPKNIILKLNTRIMRDKILAAARGKKSLNSNDLSISGTPQLIYFNEHLTLDNKKLFRMCREEASKHGYKYVWVKHGVILTRKSDTSPVLVVRSANDLQKIKP